MLNINFCYEIIIFFQNIFQKIYLKYAPFDKLFEFACDFYRS